MTSDELASQDFAQGTKNESLYNQTSSQGYLYRHGWHQARRLSEQAALDKEESAKPKPILPKGPSDLFGNPL